MQAGDETTPAAEGGRTPTLRERAEACNPQPLVPIATCVVAVFVWIGAACADGSAYACVARAACAAPMAWAMMFGAAAAGSGAMALVVLRAPQRHTPRWPWCALALLAIAAGLLGAGLRLAQVTGDARVPRFVAAGSRAHGDADSGALVVVEGTVASSCTTVGFATDILARYFRKAPSHRCLLRDVCFVGDDGVRIAVDDDAGAACFLSVSISGARPEWHVGQRLRCVGRFHAIARATNPGGGDFAEVAARRHLVGTLALDSETLASEVAGWQSPTPIARAQVRVRAAAVGRRARLCVRHPERPVGQHHRRRVQCFRSAGAHARPPACMLARARAHAAAWDGSGR